jgi:hypothetical protein
MPISTAQIAQLLQPGIRKIRGDYPEIPAQWSLIFARGKSDLQVEKTQSVRLLGLPGLKGQGQATNFDNNAGTRWTYNHLHQAVGLGYSFTREAMDDNLYKSQFTPTNLGLMKSFRQFKEILAADVFNLGNVYNPAVGGDGYALFSTSHPVDGYTVPNTPSVAVGLNEATLEMASNQVRAFRDNAGLLISAQSRKLFVPKELRRVAKRLLETQLRPGTANNDLNAAKENGDFDEGYIVGDFLTSPYSWFVITDNGGFIYLERVPFETDMQVDFTTDNLLVKAYERYFIGYDDWRAGWASFPTN